MEREVDQPRDDPPDLNPDGREMPEEVTGPVDPESEPADVGNATTME